MCDKFVTFDQKLKTHGMRGYRANFLGVIGRGVSRKRRALHSLPTNMGVPTVFISYYNLNFIKYLLVMSIFSTLAGGHKCINEQHACSNKSGNLLHSAKVLNSDFFHVHVQSHIFKII